MKLAHIHLWMYVTFHEDERRFGEDGVIIDVWDTPGLIEKTQAFKVLAADGQILEYVNTCLEACFDSIKVTPPSVLDLPIFKVHQDSAFIQAVKASFVFNHHRMVRYIGRSVSNLASDHNLI